MLLQRLKRLWRHAWTDEADVRRAVPSALLQRLMQRVGASERRHSGEIRILLLAVLAQARRSAPP
jgi:hypothetical protein